MQELLFSCYFSDESPMRGCAPPLPPAYTFQPSTVPIIPTSFRRLSVQELRQPDTPIFILLGISRDKYLAFNLHAKVYAVLFSAFTEGSTWADFYAAYAVRYSVRLAPCQASPMLYLRLLLSNL